MVIIPAIDIKGGRVVRLLQGDFNKVTFYSDEPVEVAKKWESEGAKSLHIVDLDGALTGEPKNLKPIEDILHAVKTPVEIGGGLRREEDVDRILSKGAQRAIIGTRAVIDEKFLKGLIDKFKDRVAVGLDARGYSVVTKGWRSSTTTNLIDSAKRIQSLGVATLIYTNVLKDGTMQKPQLELVKEILDAVKMKVIVSGGISSLQDIEDIKSLGRENLYGVIVGKALYENRFSIAEANRVAEGE